MRLPCNPIFPIGPIYLADHLHKCFPDLPQRILDLAALPVLDVEGVLLNVVDQFRPTLLVFSAYAIAMALLSKVVLRIPLGMTYALWSGIGTVAIVLVGRFAYSQLQTFVRRNPHRRLRS